MEQIAVNRPVSKHLLGKLKRRRAILDAAREIITTLGEPGLTMRAMAARAGVSPATPYNLFGSKQAVLQAIYDEDQEAFYAALAAKASSDPLARLFDLIDLGIAYWAETPDFHKALLAILYRSSATHRDEDGERPRLATIQVRQLVADAVGAGLLRSDSPVDIVTVTLVRIFRAAGQEWIDGTISLEEARRDLGGSLALMLAGLVETEASERLARIAGRYRSE